MSNQLKETIIGIGTDITEVKKIKKIINKNPNFIKKIFTKDEQAYCLKHKNSSIRFAGRFAAKEAIVKSLNTGFNSKVGYLDINILNEKSGKPYVILSKKTLDFFPGINILLSISHCDDYAIGYAVSINKINE